MQTLKAKQSLHYTHAQVSSPSKEYFFPNQKPAVLHPTTKKQRTKPHGLPGNAYLVGWKVGVTRTYANKKLMKSSLKALLEEF